MLIYCSRISLVPKSPIEAVLGVTADWLRIKTGKAVAIRDLGGEGEWTLPDKSTLEWLNAVHEGASWCGIRYTHPDRETRGREWLTEIGLYRDADLFTCTVLLRTHESSALVEPNVQTTRPKLVADIFDRCQIASETGGGKPRLLRAEDAEAFLYEINSPERVHPIVQVCHTQDGRLLVAPERLASQLAGVATVAVIPPDVDTFELAEVLTPRLCCYHGAVNIIWPKVNTASGPLAPNFRVLGPQLEAVLARGVSPESKLLATICHRMNEVFARDHISPEMVRAVKHRAALAEARKTAPQGDPELEALAQQVDVDQRAEIERLKAEMRSRDNELAAVKGLLEESELEIQSLNHSVAKMSARNSDPEPQSISEEMRSVLTAAMGEEASVYDGLKVVALLFPDRITILDTAWRSAKDAAEFNKPRKAFDLLCRLCTGYWEALANGGSDADAKLVFGNAFSAKESETGEANKRAKKLRTFSYNGKDTEMMMHLKIGNKPSVAETFRAYFEWDAKRKRVILGHCGKHLDLK